MKKITEIKFEDRPFTFMAVIGSILIFLLMFYSYAGSQQEEKDKLHDKPVVMMKDNSIEPVVTLENRINELGKTVQKLTKGNKTDRCLIHESITGRHFTLEASAGNINTLILPFNKYNIHFAHGQGDHAEYDQTVLFKIPDDEPLLTATAINLEDTSEVISLAFVAKKIEPQIHQIRFK